MKNARNFLVFLLLGFAAPGTAQITVGTIPMGILCANVQMELPYTASGTYNAGNTFTAELSDVNGSFATPTVLGSVVSTASGTITCIFPAGLSGNDFQLRVNSSDPLELGVPTTGLLMEAPDAGTSATATICGSTVNAFPLLGGTPEPGGNWIVVIGSMTWGGMGDLFAGVTNGSVVEYHVTSPGGCPAMAQLEFYTVEPPNPGTSASMSVCSSDAPFPMYQLMGGSPDAGGTWTNPGGAPQPPTFTPGVSVPGCYTYTVPGIAPCPNAGSALCITVSPIPNAGTDATLTWCQSSGALDLFAQLGGTPATGGTWSDLNATGQLSGATFNAGAVPAGSYAFQYTVDAAPCASATATVTVNVNACFSIPPVGNFATE